MARFKWHTSRFPTSQEGLYVRRLTPSTYERLGELVEAVKGVEEGGEAEAPFYALHEFMFAEVYCAEDGKPFDEASEPELVKSIDVGSLQDAFTAAMEAISESVEAEAKKRSADRSGNTPLESG